jgi:hypothetical protein
MLIRKSNIRKIQETSVLLKRIHIKLIIIYPCVLGCLFLIKRPHEILVRLLISLGQMEFTKAMMFQRYLSLWDMLYLLTHR